MLGRGNVAYIPCGYNGLLFATISPESTKPAALVLPILRLVSLGCGTRRVLRQPHRAGVGIECFVFQMTSLVAGLVVVWCCTAALGCTPTAAVAGSFVDAPLCPVENGGSWLAFFQRGREFGGPMVPGPGGLRIANSTLKLGTAPISVSSRQGAGLGG